MSEQIEVEKKKNLPPRGERGGRKPGHRFPKEVRLRAVRMILEEGFKPDLVCDEIGACKSIVAKWVAKYHQHGEAGLQSGYGTKREPKLPEPITEKIIELKKENPTFGIKRISQILRRLFFLPASPETVRQRLHEAELMPESSPPKKRNVTRPRFFERATPNQMWQTDIFTFRLGGRYAYLIAFMDDYSRFIVGADLFRSPTAEAVIEVYRVAVGEFQPPKEMLTDNGRQYTSWRGVSRFEAELKKDRVAHFKSRPQHPMTLGKVERFWETIWQEFLVRAQFDSFDMARERIKLWIKYYNHKRPHQGIEGLCPADRFFEIQTQLRQTIETGIQDNLLELALRGKPQAPFYMVGRMDGQSVVLRAEKGKLKLSVSDHQNLEQELTYDLNQNASDQRKEGTEKETQPTLTQRPGQSPGGAGRVDGTVQAGGCVPPAQHQLDHLQSLAAPGDGGNAPGVGEPGQLEQGRSPESAVANAAAQTTAHNGGGQALPAAGTGPTKEGCLADTGCGKNGIDEVQSQTTGRTDLPSPLGPDDGHGRSPQPGHLPPAVLPVGEACPAGPHAGTGGSAHGAAQDPKGSGEAGPAAPDQTTGTPGGAPARESTVAPAPGPMDNQGQTATR
jgi:transposase InsO family protein